MGSLVPDCSDRFYRLPLRLSGLQLELQSSNGFFKTFHLTLLCSNT